jgi:hypothetical protein
MEREASQPVGSQARALLEAGRPRTATNELTAAACSGAICAARAWQADRLGAVRAALLLADKVLGERDLFWDVPPEARRTAPAAFQRLAYPTPYHDLIVAAAAKHGVPPSLLFAVARRIDTGICHINGPTVHDEAQMPFGGVKASGYGRFGGKAGIAPRREMSACGPDIKVRPPLFGQRHLVFAGFAFEKIFHPLTAGVDFCEPHRYMAICTLGMFWKNLRPF